MHCDCCNHMLDDEEATAKFAESGNYVSMCKLCRAYLPRDIKVVLRPDLIGKKAEEEVGDNWLANHDPLYQYGEEDE
jgi:hypothetical protein